MNIGQEMIDAIKNNLGWELAVTTREVRDSVPQVLACNDTFCIVTCTENDKPYVEAMKELVNNGGECKIIMKQGRSRLPSGKGFGDKVWRKNTKHDGIELSFAGKPDERTRTIMKSLGFRWSHISGVWYLANKKCDEPVWNFVNMNFKQVEDN